MGLPTFSMQRPVMTAMVFAGVVLLGIISLFRLDVELYQGQNQGIISIVIRARGGLHPVEVEKRITRPIEEVMATVSRLQNLYSSSREGESRVTMEFEAGTDMDFVSLEIREKFSRVKPLLPSEIEKPVIANYDEAESAIYVFALTSKTLSPEQIREVVDSELKPVLGRVNGVASVEVYGGRERKILVELDRDKMVAYNVSVEKVMDILGKSNVNLLAGAVDRGTLELSVRSMGAFTDVNEVGEIGIQATRQGSIIRLKEIATIKDSYLEPSDFARLNLEQNVTVYVKKTSVAMAIQVVKELREVLNMFKMRYRDTLDMITIADKGEVISRAITDVENALWVGMFLTLVLIYFFLRRVVLSLIVMVSIPCSLLATFILMSFFKISINVMTLSGLALAIGILVDSAIVILENIFSKKEAGFTDAQAIREGAEEMWQPLLASLMTTLIVFLPIVFIDKKIQMTYSGFAFTVAGSLVASFFVAQMLIPTLMRQWARGRIAADEPQEAQPETGSEIPASQESDAYDEWDESAPRNLFWEKCKHWLAALVAREREQKKSGAGIQKVREVYLRLMRWNLSKRYWVVLVLIVLFGFSVWRLTRLSMDLPSAMQEDEFSIVVFPLAGARVEANDDAVKRVEELLAKIPDVERSSSTIRKDDVRIFVKLKPKRKRQYSKDEVIRLVDEKGNEMIKQIHDDYSLIIDQGASVSEQKKLIIHIFGHDNDVLEKMAIEVANRVSKVPGFSNLVMTDLRKRPEYSLVVDKGRAAVYGLTVRDVADSIHAQVRGMRPTKFHELKKGNEIETITRLQAIYRQKIEDLKLIHIATPYGIQIPLGEIANFYPSVGPTTIDRKDKYRYVFVKGDPKRALEAVAEDVKKQLRDIKMPEDYYWRFGGTYEDLMKGKSQLVVAFLVTLFLVYAVMACLFENIVQPLLIMLAAPFASIGVWLALAVTGKDLSQQVMIGGILLAGYVSNAAIILVDHMNRLKQKGMPREERLVQAGLDRLRPILMTTLSTCCGFLPMALNLGQSSDLWSPLAVTVIGGLVVSTILTLFVLPDFIYITEEWAEKAKNFLKTKIFSRQS